MFLKVEGSWLYSVRLRKLRRRGVHEPLLYLLRVWQYALNECGDTVPELDEESIAMLEETVQWDGDDGALLSALRAVGYLEDNRLALWWDDGAEDLSKKRKQARLRKRRQRAQPKRDSHAPGSVTDHDVTRDSHDVTRDNERPRGPDGRYVTPPENSVTDHNVTRDNHNVTRDKAGRPQQSRVEKKLSAHAHAQVQAPTQARTRAREDVDRNIAQVPPPKEAPVAPYGGLAVQDWQQDEWSDIRQGFAREYTRRVNASPSGRNGYNPGFFGENGAFDVDAYLEELARNSEPCYRVLMKWLPRFWLWWDERQKAENGRNARAYPQALKPTLDKYLLRNGLPAPLQRLKQRAGSKRAFDNRG